MPSLQIMLNVCVNNYIFILPHLVFISLSWIFFIKQFFLPTKIKPFVVDIHKKFNLYRKVNFKLLLKFSILMQFSLLLSFYTLKSCEGFVLWQHIFISNSNVTLVYYCLLLNLVCFLLIYLFSKKSNLKISSDYAFSLSNANVVLPLIFFANTILTLLFLLELVSCLIFYKFTVSKFWFKRVRKSAEVTSVTKYVNKLLPKTYVNTLFFQYWSTFFSSVLILYSIVIFFLQYGTTEWGLIEFLVKLSSDLNQFSCTDYLSFVIPFVLGFLVKLGLVPFHLYKIEVYKGVPYVTLLFYTTYYFFVYFVFFMYSLVKLITIMSAFVWAVLSLIVILGSFFLVFKIFDGNFFKNFFAYSTLINAFNFFILSLFLI